ncbi:hypothetical protein [Acinetobacter rudis]|uniref:Uncharacterized protein n=1 Tax=Acinetobacter rudis CIP 110305 TaxID=421052 RepID=S3N4A0_9GAMM|nr:hypothetical protein [Acinetobacter rudis]EPF74637.1 hypothetical protein F945_01404 [Acinetobacter rudis CIP 110305]
MKVFNFSLLLLISSHSVASSSIFDKLGCGEIGNEAGKAIADLHTSRQTNELTNMVQKRVEESATNEGKNLARFYWIYLITFNKSRSIYKKQTQILVIEKAKSIAIENCIQKNHRFVELKPARCGAVFGMG